MFHFSIHFSDRMKSAVTIVKGRLSGAGVDVRNEAFPMKYFRDSCDSLRIGFIDRLSVIFQICSGIF